jgi:O-methyltransferase involved in polyketide biosynthesis
VFVCEGVLRYLPEHWWRELLRVAAARAAPGSELAVSISVRQEHAGERGSERREHEERLARSGEPVLTVPDPETALRWVAESGWRTTGPGANVTDTPRWLLVRARC